MSPVRLPAAAARSSGSAVPVLPLYAVARSRTAVAGVLVPSTIRSGFTRLRTAAVVVPQSVRQSVRGPVRPSSAVRSQNAAALQDPKGSVGIFGAGAAGLAAAYFAAQNPDLPVTVYEKTSEVGKKIKASGGSRCNILPNPDRPLNVDDDFYFPPATKKGAIRALLGSWNLDGCRVWLEDDIGIPLKLEEDADKLFPQSDSGVEVRDKLLAAVARHPNVHVETGAELMGIEIDEGSSSSGRLFRCRLADGREQAHARVVLATGGKSFASLGTTGTGYEILRGLGVAVNAPEPALTPLLFAKKENELVNLAGVTLQHAMMTVSYTGDDGFTPSKASPSVSPQNNDETKGVKKKKRAKPKVRQAVRGQSLITHRGVSGPDAMDLSYFSNLPSEAGVTYRVCWSRDFQTPGHCEAFLTQTLRTNPKKTVRSIIASILPASLAAFLCDAANIDQHTNISSLKKADRAALVQLITAYELDIGKNEGFAKAEVSAGGVPLHVLDLSTMELRDIPGCHVVGELVDIHGRIGGFNFLLAWVEGRLAGRAIADRTYPGT